MGDGPPARFYAAGGGGGALGCLHAPAMRRQVRRKGCPKCAQHALHLPPKLKRRFAGPSSSRLQLSFWSTPLHRSMPRSLPGCWCSRPRRPLLAARARRRRRPWAPMAAPPNARRARSKTAALLPCLRMRRLRLMSGARSIKCCTPTLARCAACCVCCCVGAV